MRKLLLMLFIATTALPGAARAQFCPGAAPYVFTDVPASDAFCGYITWMAATGVTTGCQVIDANNRLYCPDDFVSRKQMAAFMKRQADAVMPLTCTPGQVMKWNGTAWACAADNIGGSGSGGTVTSVLAGTGLTASPNPITGVGSINLAPSYQLPQGCGTSQIAKWNGSAWNCAADIDTNSGGTVTSVSTGAGLSGGTIITAGTISIAPGGVGSVQLASDAVSTDKLAPNSVTASKLSPQLGLPGQVLTTDGANLGWTNVAGNARSIPLVVLPRVTRLLPFSPVEVAFGDDFLPAFATLQPSAWVRCRTQTCSEYDSSPLPNFQGHSSTLAADRYPLILGYGSGSVQVMKCSDLNCATYTVNTIDGSAGAIAALSKMHLGQDGLPYFAFVIFSGNMYTVKFVKCLSENCSGVSLITTLTSSNAHLGGVSAGPALDGLPMIGYTDNFRRLHVTKCANQYCIGGTVTTTTTATAMYTDLITTGDGYPLFLLRNPGGISVRKCANADCSQFGSGGSIGAGGVGVVTGSLALGSDGFPVVAWHDQINGDLMVTKCGSPSCSENNTTVIADSDGVVGMGPMIGIGLDGLPLIVYASAAQTPKLMKFSPSR